MPKFCEITIAPPEDSVMGAPAVYRVAVPLVNLANATAEIDKTGMRVVGISEFDAMSVEEFAKTLQWTPLVAAITGPFKAEEEIVDMPAEPRSVAQQATDLAKGLSVPGAAPESARYAAGPNQTTEVPPNRAWVTEQDIDT